MTDRVEVADDPEERRSDTDVEQRLPITTQYATRDNEQRRRAHHVQRHGLARGGHAGDPAEEADQLLEGAGLQPRIGVGVLPASRQQDAAAVCEAIRVRERGAVQVDAGSRGPGEHGEHHQGDAQRPRLASPRPGANHCFGPRRTDRRRAGAL